MRRLLLLSLVALCGCRAALGGSHEGVPARPSSDEIRVVVVSPGDPHADALAIALDKVLAADARIAPSPASAPATMPTSSPSDPCAAARAVDATYMLRPHVESAVDAAVRCVREKLTLSKNGECAEYADDTDRVRVTAGVAVMDVRTCATVGLDVTVTETVVSDDHDAAIAAVVTKAIAALQAKPLFPAQGRVASVDAHGARMDIADADVHVDDVFVAYRGEERVGRVIVTHVAPDHATLEGLSGGIEPRAGDALVPRGRMSWWELAPRLVWIGKSEYQSSDTGASGPGAVGFGLQLRRSPTGSGLIAGIAGDVVAASDGTGKFGGVEAGWRLRAAPSASLGVIGGLYAAHLEADRQTITDWTASVGVHLLLSSRSFFVVIEAGYMRDTTGRWNQGTVDSSAFTLGGAFLRLAFALSL